MKNILKVLIILLTITMVIKADDSKYKLVLSVSGLHYKNNEYYNNDNKFIGLEYELKSKNTIMISTFENSFNTRSYAINYSYKFRKDKSVQPFISVGLCKGYEKGQIGNIVVEDGKQTVMRYEGSINQLYKDYSLIGYIGVEFNIKDRYCLTIATTHYNVIAMVKFDL